MLPHSDSEALRLRFARAARLVVPWNGVAYRTAAVKYANRDDILSGQGAKHVPGRWNPPGSAAAVYTSLAPETAVAESLANHRYYRLPVEMALPRMLMSIRFALQSVLDLTDARVRRTFGFTRVRLFEDWRAGNRNGREALSQAVGRLAWDAEWEAILVPSVAAAGGTNLIVFPANLKPPGSYMVVVNRGQLPPRIEP